MVPFTFNALPSFVNVALPVFVNVPSTCKLPALFVTVASAPLFSTDPTMFNPAVPVSLFVNVIPLVLFTLAPDFTFRPPAPLLVIVSRPSLFVRLPVTFNAEPVFVNVDTPVLVKLPPILISPAWLFATVVPLFSTVPSKIIPPSPVLR